MTFEGNSHAPVWAPDGESLAVSSDREGPQANLWLVHADGSGKPQKLTTSANHQDPASFSPDGRLLAYGEISGGDLNCSLWIVHLAEGNRVEPFLQTKFGAHSPAISPNGKWIAYTSDESGRAEVYVQRFPGGGGRYQVSIGGGGEPLWRPDGREIYYRNGDAVMSAAVTAEGGFSTGKPSLLFHGNYVPEQGFGHPNWDISRDGKRFMMMQPYDPPQKKPRQIEVVVNWFEELRRVNRGAGH